MPRKRKTDYPFAGRPPKDPEKKVGTPARALVTILVADAIVEDAHKHGIPDPERGLIASDILRLYIWRGLEHGGLMTEDLRNDPTWDSLKQKGLV